MAGVYAAVDLGGSKVTCALGTADGALVCSQTIPTESHRGPEAVLKRIAGVVRALSREAGGRPEALGMGVPGLADLKHGATVFLPNLEGKWRNVKVRDLLSPKVGCPVYLLNDVRAATLAELTFGRGRGVGTMAFFAIGTGIGGGIAVDGKLRLGPLGAAGELGHQIILPDGPRCGCGSRGCLETLASGPAITAEGVRLVRSGQAPILNELVDEDVSRITATEVARAAEQGDGAAKAAIVRAAEYLGIGVANVVVTLHPELVVLGGGVAQIGPLLFDTVRRTVRERVRMIPARSVRIEPSELGADAGVLGGIALAMKRGLIFG